MSDSSPERKGCKPWICLGRTPFALSVIAEFFTEEEAVKCASERASDNVDSFYFVARVERVIVQLSVIPGSVVSMSARVLEEVYGMVFRGSPEDSTEEGGKKEDEKKESDS